MDASTQADVESAEEGARNDVDVDALGCISRVLNLDGVGEEQRVGREVLRGDQVVTKGGRRAVSSGH